MTLIKKKNRISTKKHHPGWNSPNRECSRKEDRREEEVTEEFREAELRVEKERTIGPRAGEKKKKKNLLLRKKEESRASWEELGQRRENWGKKKSRRGEKPRIREQKKATDFSDIAAVQKKEGITLKEKKKGRE